MKNKWENEESESKDEDDSIDSDFELSVPAAGKFDIDTIIAQLLSPKVRNAGILTDLAEETIIELIDRARDIMTA